MEESVIFFSAGKLSLEEQKEDIIEEYFCVERISQRLLKC